jgi:hypothetical protein
MNADSARTIDVPRLIRIMRLRPRICMALFVRNTMPAAGPLAFIGVYLRFLFLRLAEAGCGRTKQDAGGGRFRAPCVGLPWC